MLQDNPLVILAVAIASAVTAWFGNGTRLKRRTTAASSVEQLISETVARNYHQLVTEVAALRIEVERLRQDVKVRDARIDELEHDKRIYAERIDELEREVTELRDELANYRPTRRRRTSPTEES